MRQLKQIRTLPSTSSQDLCKHAFQKKKDLCKYDCSTSVETISHMGTALVVCMGADYSPLFL